jgi:hypothetical protein
VVCPLGFPVEVTLLAVLDVSQVHAPGRLLGLWDAPRVRPSRPPVRNQAQKTQCVEHQEPESSPGGQRDPRKGLIRVERLKVPVEEAEIVPAEVSIEEEQHSLHSLISIGIELPQWPSRCPCNHRFYTLSSNTLL